MTKAKEVKNRIKKYGMVDWKTCEWFQPKDLKKQSKEKREKLKASLIANGFASPMFLFTKGKKEMIIDGHHRRTAMEEMESEGIKIPAKLPALWLDVKNEKEAMKLVLILTSQYTKIDFGTLADIIDDSKFTEVEMLNFSLPEIKMRDFFHAFNMPEEGDAEEDSEKGRLDKIEKRKCPHCGGEL